MSAIWLAAALLLGAFVHRPLLGRLGVGTLQHLVRLPGNFVHELAHALAMLATGYTVVGFSVSLTDAAGRGGVRPGAAWLPIARPWITNLVAPIAPVPAGLLALAALHAWSGAPGLVASASGTGAALAAVEWGRWELWVGLALAFSVAAELAPSGPDLAAWWRPALVTAVCVAAGSWGLERWGGVDAFAWLGVLDAVVRPTIARALAMVVWGGLAFAPVAWGVGRLRGGA